MLFYPPVNIYCNCLGELGQQIIHSWVDMRWVKNIFEKVISEDISKDAKNLAIITVWLEEYKNFDTHLHGASYIIKLYCQGEVGNYDEKCFKEQI